MYKIITLIILSGALIFSGIIYFSAPSFATDTKCGGVETSFIKCSSDGTEKDVKQSAIWQILKIVVGVMTGGVTIAALGGIIYGSVLYSSSGSNPEQKKKAMSIITNTVIGIVAFAAMWASLNFIIPGGIGL